MIKITKDALITLWLVWTLMLAGHWLREAWIIFTRGFHVLPVCRRWWCPEGIRNRWRNL